MKQIYDILDIYCDGGARGNPGRAAIGVVAKTAEKIVFQFGKKIGVATNNVAEYQAVIAALEFLGGEGIKTRRVNFYLDAQTVVKQLNNLFEVKQPHLRELLLKVRLLENTVGGEICYFQIPREKNRFADFLVNQELDRDEV